MTDSTPQLPSASGENTPEIQRQQLGGAAQLPDIDLPGIDGYQLTPGLAPHA